MKTKSQRIDEIGLKLLALGGKNIGGHPQRQSKRYQFDATFGDVTFYGYGKSLLQAAERCLAEAELKI